MVLKIGIQDSGKWVILNFSADPRSLGPMENGNMLLGSNFRESAHYLLVASKPKRWTSGALSNNTVSINIHVERGHTSMNVRQ